MPPRIRIMTPGNISAGMRLKEAVGWNQTQEDWERFLQASPEGCFVAEQDGRVAGTVTTIVYESFLLRCMKNLIIAVAPSLLFFAVALGTCAAQEPKAAPDENGPRVFSLPRAALQQIKSGITAGKIIDPALDRLRSDADTALKQEPLSV